MKKEPSTTDTKAVGALLEVLRAHGVKTYEAGTGGAVRVEFYPPALLNGRRPAVEPSAPAVPAQPDGPASESAPVTEAPSGDVAAPRGALAGLTRDDPLFRGVNLQEVVG